MKKVDWNPSVNLISMGSTNVCAKRTKELTGSWRMYAADARVSNNLEIKGLGKAKQIKM